MQGNSYEKYDKDIYNRDKENAVWPVCDLSLSDIKYFDETVKQSTNHYLVKTW